jgi:ABC-type bacteriocin/lantibiotic exporter with double-glycine peptidase domain
MNATCSSPFGLHIGAVIAFTTVLPMSHVTAIYAEWSGKINSQRYQLLSDAQSRMGEAINNMRTVRAVSSEEHESKLNDGTLDKCLQIGVRDACYSSLTEGFNSYLDLGAGVLILWYGGTIAMAPQGAISIGALIKFRMPTSAFNPGLADQR